MYWHILMNLKLIYLHSHFSFKLCRLIKYRWAKHKKICCHVRSWYTLRSNLSNLKSFPYKYVYILALCIVYMLFLVRLIVPLLSKSSGIILICKSPKSIKVLFSQMASLGAATEPYILLLLYLLQP